MNKLHLCVGFYPNGQFKINTVCDENLQDNIEYNRKWRPGRFYFVDGEHVCGGLFREPYQTEFIEQCKQKMKELNMQPGPKDSLPYV